MKRLFLFLALCHFSCAKSVDREERLERIRQLNQEGKYSEAIIKIGEYTYDYPDDSEWRYAKAVVHFNLRNYLTSLNSVDSAIVMQSDSGKYYFLKGMLLYRLELLDSAKTQFKISLKKQTKISDSYTQLAVIANQENDLDKTVSYYDSALIIDNRNSLAMIGKGFALYDLKEYQEAISYFKNGLETSNKTKQENMTIHAFIAGSYETLEKIDSACIEWKYISENSESNSKWKKEAEMKIEQICKY